MELNLTNITYRHHHRQQPLPLNHHRPYNSINFPKSPSFAPLTSIKSSSHNPNYETSNHHTTKFINPNSNPNPLSSLKTTVITGVTVAVVLLSRLTIKPPPAAAIPPPATVETANPQSKTLGEKKPFKTLTQIKTKIVHEWIEELDQLIEQQPEDSVAKWMKHSLQSYIGDHKSAILGFKEIITKDPLCFMSYYGLIRAASATRSVNELKDVENLILKLIALCKQGNEKDVVREFKILLADIRVINGDYDNAVKIYDALVKEELKDFMLYLNRGIVYIQWWRRLMMTKVFAHKVESERASLKS
ncbi:putative tetratricopeptide-like helical domain superfamily [Helianthus annuus]|uniref:Tetratricopeptide-like helical domain superfamily n=1 Tax=Helianthus annuus TaxID=4232 RepID=A0A9K3HTG6_HELAN|nr:uncharacterized protein LOC110888865 [Helianthus annuus]KAF5783961.1 putative tetratricopeptide-like helical domain superfamily [Helianthus annuus]KAJ0519170.1 putative tetratricopeptide-like helical domain superfamily [Helianthus annuus]KAJ0690965.1 putative tetratricopeptide-like helical domain superfamily [Helianthus annuus]KAJ0872633.1 putative tetratricopeptide-like helical domain superfamily [Helianthus annuus]